MRSTAAGQRSRGVRAAGKLASIGAWALSGAVSAALVGRAYAAVAGDRMAPWIIGRAAGVTAYLLLVALLLMGLVLSHPWRTRLRRPATSSRIRLHIALAVFTAAFTALHIVALATDRYAGVGWQGALLPMGASYRPVATTLGLIGLWSGALTGVTAALAGRLPLQMWWPIHKVAALSWVLIWMHGVLGGGDTGALLPLYLVTGAIVMITAFSRYVSRTPADLRAEVTS